MPGALETFDLHIQLRKRFPYFSSRSVNGLDSLIDCGSLLWQSGA